MLASQYVERVSLRRELVESFDRYPFNLPLLRGFERLDLHPKVTFLVGENGSGKSTLLEAIAIALGFNAEGGSRNFDFATRETHSDLHDFLRIARGWRKPKDGFFLRAESFYNVATAVDNLGVEDSYGGRSLHARSHGEAFLALLTHRFRGQGLYLLDEPEAALSPARQLAVLQRLHDLVVQDSQFIIATHSPILMAYPDAAIVQCGPEGLVPVAYEDTEHYQVTRRFLAHREAALDIIMGTSRPRS
jgi:predicted ATPase